MYKYIHLIEGSSVDEKVISEVKKYSIKAKNILVILDSLHTHKHGAKELEMYSQYVSINSYLVVFDTVIEYMPKGIFIEKPWDKGNNPATAVNEFMKKNKNYIVDKEIDQKLIISSAPGGYLKRIK